MSEAASTTATTQASVAADPGANAATTPSPTAAAAGVQLLLTVPDAVLEAIAARAAALALERLEDARSEQQPVSPWLDARQAMTYLGFTRDRLYKLTSAGAIPCHRRRGGRRLLFHRGELDHWIRHAYTGEDEAGG